ncbi:MAG TPA: YfiR/HmsC family protein [Bacteroidales bacterium]
MFCIKFKPYRYIILLVIFLNLFHFTSYAQFSKSKETISSGLYVFIVNTTWRTENSITKFQIGVLDSDTVFYNLLIKKYEGVKIKRKPSIILHFSKIEDIKSTQVLYVGRMFNKYIGEISKVIEGNNTLLITNICGDDKYRMIDFNGILRKKLFEVNEENIEKAGLKLSQQFIEFAEGRIGWQELYIHSESLLDRERDIVNTQLNTINKRQNIINCQMDTIKKVQHTVINQSNEIFKQNQILKMQRLILVLLGLILILVLVFLFFIFRSYHQKKEANRTITQKNIEIAQAYEEILAQRDEIEAQRDMVITQKKQIENIYQELTDSIRYASLIQTAVLPNNQKIKEIIPNDNFILYKPKNIVSGDFFFIEKYKNRSFIAVGDCTGHGVPGAFMSMLSMGFLKEIVYNQPLIQADQVLNHLRTKIISALQQKGLESELKDGMDLSLLIIDNDTSQCHWAGAYISLYMYSVLEQKLVEIKPDKQPIAIYPEMQEFTNHEISLQRGDVLYLFTDGIVDQFGGPIGKKFMYKQFRELLFANSPKPMYEQYQIIRNAIEKWRTSYDIEYEQTDDITVLGLKM